MLIWLGRGEVFLDDVRVETEFLTGYAGIVASEGLEERWPEGQEGDQEE